MLPRIAVTMGDPAGIGPEIAVMALSRPEVFSFCRPVVYGDEGVLRRAAALVGLDAGNICRAGAAEAPPGRIAVLPLSSLSLEEVPFGRRSLSGSCAMAEYIRAAAADALAGRA
ncbi:MAG: 4-hydroxythreonine-4-phosphate dehydrogenase PdxA, partial [Deltaproteobacteria bacterium]